MKHYFVGDNRVNEQPGLTVYHTVWVREHNRLAKQLAYLNPHWDDERLYQEARKIVIAENQHVTYNEWLPLVLGTDYMAELDILPVTYGYNNNYDPKVISVSKVISVFIVFIIQVNPAILNSFAAAAFRFGHSLIQGMLE